MIKKSSRQQTKMVSFRVLPKAHKNLLHEAEQKNLSVGALIKKRVFGKGAKAMKTSPRKPLADLEELRKILGQLGKIGSNVNQIAKHLNQGNNSIDSHVHKNIQEDLNLTRRALLDALGVSWDKED